MQDISPEELLRAAYVVLAILAAIVTIDKVIDIIKKWRAPGTDTEKKLANDKKRLDEHDEAISDLRDSNQVICSALLAILDHELHNGNGDQMQKARDEMMAYLSKHIAK